MADVGVAWVWLTIIILPTSHADTMDLAHSYQYSSSVALVAPLSTECIRVATPC